MPNDLLQQAKQANELLRTELRMVREDVASVIYALDCACELADGLMAFFLQRYENEPLPANLAACKERLDQALIIIRGRTQR